MALEESPENNAYQARRISQMMQDSTGAATMTGDAESSFWDGLTNYDQRFGAGLRVRVNGVISDLVTRIWTSTHPKSAVRLDAIAHVPSGTVLVYGFGSMDKINSFGDYAVLESAPLEVRRRMSVWGAPLPEWKLAERIKQVFDPGRVLNRGRFVGGI